jgi:dihydroxy-acid dehydratase
MIELDVAQRKIHLDINNEELEKRRAAWVAPKPATERGYVNLYIKHVMQADKGADLDFLQGSSGSEVTRDSH